MMAVVVNGHALTRDDLVRVAREGYPVVLDPAAITRSRHVPALAAGAMLLEVEGLVAAVRAGDFAVDVRQIRDRSPADGGRR